MGSTLKWDYKNWKFHIYIPGYVAKAIKGFGHEPPPKLQYKPNPCAPPNYGAKIQYAKSIDHSHSLSKGDKTFVMQVTGTFNFYVRAIDSTMLPSLIKIAPEQNAPTKNTMKRVKKFLDCAVSEEEAITMFNSSGMVLAIHSDTSYMSKNNARSRAGGHHFVSSDE